MGNMFASSDYHLDHRNILEYDHRPFSSIEEMQEVIVKNHNSVVKPNDTVYFLGDLLMSDSVFKAKEFLSRFNGNWHIILGNHDKALRKMRRANDYFNGKIKSYENLDEITINGQLIILCHYAMRVWDRSHRNSWNLYAHSHCNLPPIGKQMDVGIMGNNYYPYSFEDIKKIMDARPMHESLDHHRPEGL